LIDCEEMIRQGAPVRFGALPHATGGQL
jgi:hypothetical protein